MAWIEHSDLDRTSNMSADNFIRAFDLPLRLARAVKYIVRYARNKDSNLGYKDLRRAIDELIIERRYAMKRSLNKFNSDIDDIESDDDLIEGTPVDWR